MEAALLGLPDRQRLRSGADCKLHPQGARESGQHPLGLPVCGAQWHLLQLTTALWSLSCPCFSEWEAAGQPYSNAWKQGLQNECQPLPGWPPSDTMCDHELPPSTYGQRHSAILETGPLGLWDKEAAQDHPDQGSSCFIL